MNQKTKWKEFIILVAFTVSFWGIFYPNFSLTEDVCVIRYEDGSRVEIEDLNEEALQELLDKELISKKEYERLSEKIDKPTTYMDLREHKVTYKSKLFEWIKRMIR
ncbi:MAG: hypothetical protein IJX86_04980 [Lachnospiraceae bacterium]|nr:hypothetical protein [Lachnospiraceae bacterium]